MSFKLKRSIYGLKQAFRSWNTRFDQCPDEFCVYKNCDGSVVVFLVLYVDDILLIGNDVGVLSSFKVWLSNQFDMKDLGEASHILGIKLLRDRFLVLYVDDILLIDNDVGVLSSVKVRLSSQFDMKDLGEASHILRIKLPRDLKQRMLGFSLATYIDQILARFSMQDSKKGFLPFKHGITLSKDQYPQTPDEIEKMKAVPYASAVGSLMYAMLCTRPGICFVVGMVIRYQSNPRQEHWTTVKHIIKYLKRTRYYMLVYHVESLVPLGYTDSDFHAVKDSKNSTSSYVFTLGSGAISWRCIKQSFIADSTMEAECVAASKATKEAVWLRNFLLDLEVVPSMQLPITLYCDNSGEVANLKEPMTYKKGKHIERKYHLIRDIVQIRDVVVTKIASADNLADPFTKSLLAKTFDKHVEGMGVRCVASWL